MQFKFGCYGNKMGKNVHFFLLFSSENFIIFCVGHTYNLS